AGGAPREQPDGGVVPMGLETLALAAAVEVVDGQMAGKLAPDHDQAGLPGGGGRRLGHRLGPGAIHEGDRGAGAVDHRRHGSGLQFGVDHHGHRPDAEDPEQGPDVIGTVGQGEQHPLLGGQAETAKGDAVATGQVVDLAVGQRPRIEAQGLPVALSHLQPSAQEALVDVELNGQVDHAANLTRFRDRMARHGAQFCRENGGDQTSFLGWAVMSDAGLYYHDYLQLDRLLTSQELESARAGEAMHDEMLFIIVHQAYELWFKQIRWELEDVMDALSGSVFNEHDTGRVVSRLRRITVIQQLLLTQIDVLETMTPMDFLDFRN